MFIRQAGPADSEAIVDLLSILDLDRQEWLRRHVAAGEVLIALDLDDVILGYIVADHSFFERGFVHLFFVAESARRSGVGARLLAEAVERARSDRVFTSTNLSNSPMHALLVKAGWTSAGMVVGLDESDPEVFYFIDRAGSVR